MRDPSATKGRASGRGRGPFVFVSSKRLEWCSIGAILVIMAATDPILARFRADLDRVYGPRLARVVLFGSRARGDARPDSDYDVAVFLSDLTDRWDEADRIAGVAADLLDETGAVIHAMPYRVDAYAERTPLMHEIRREGREL